MNEEPTGTQLPDTPPLAPPNPAPPATITATPTDHDTTSPPPLTETPAMEIHTHGHVHQDKKWKEYLFQFLMLFLAVTAGFFMENQREHYIENQRAHELAKSLVEDLKADTMEVHIANKRLLSVARSADTIMKQLDLPRTQQNDSVIQLCCYRLAGYNFFDAQMGTYQQMKSSGSLRYLNQATALKLTDYETHTGYLARLTEDAMAFRVQILMPFTFTLQNGKFIEAFLTRTPYKGSYFTHEPDSETLNGLYNRAARIKSNYDYYADRYIDHENRALALIDLLRKEYPAE